MTTDAPHYVYRDLLSWDDLDLSAAVDAAARDWWVRTTRSGVGFDDLNAHDQDSARAFVRPIVKAAAPQLLKGVIA